MASGTTQVLTIALLIIPVLFLARDWMPKWIHKIPFLMISIAVLFRIHAFWSIDITDAQVVGFLPSGIDGLETILHIFDGPAGLMLGLLLGFSCGIAMSEPTNIEYRWITLCWILLLGWGIDSDGFATIAATPLNTQPSILDWSSIIYPLLGFGLSMVVIPTLVNIENASLLHLSATISIVILLLDLSSSPVAWMLLSMIAHRLSSLRIHAKRGTASQRRWSGLVVTFFLSFIFLVLGLSALAMTDEFWPIVWDSRFALGWILVCGIVGALTPTMGFDSQPRPEAWGFHTGMILAPSLLPNISQIEHAQLPILMIAITVPIIATLTEYRPNLDWKRRIMEFLFLSSCLPLVILISEIIPVSLITIIAIIPLLIKFDGSVDEEE